ncbi:COG1361 S-layer family protein [Halopiger djelfimassiliensis]|uniref:COG1361 S-layer family protein n=1 Tax=Halopiger djelfimassiliensis TaxID=1293047 RepID=UPI00067761E0|nr:COG1361 S-layer family protein [Halopiger djelfimassiliensis]
MKGRTAFTVVAAVLLLTAGTVAVTPAAQSPDATSQQDDDGGLEVDDTTDSDVETVHKTVRTQQTPQLQSRERPYLRGKPDLELHVPEPKVQPGKTNEVTLQVSNDGSLDVGTAEGRDVVTAARDVRIEAEADRTPLTVESGETAIGTVTENKPREAPIAVSVPDDIESGTYSIDVEVTYAYTSQQFGSGVTYDHTRTWSTSVDVTVDDKARFSIVEATTDAQIGDTGTVEAVIENTGSETATDISVALESASASFVFGESAQDSAWIDELEPGDTATVTYDVRVAPDTSVRQYTLDGTVQFKTETGLQRVDTSPSAGVTPKTEQQFTLTDIDSELYVGEEGDLHGVITNEGPNDAQNVVVRYADKSPNVIPIERSVAVGTLAAGDSESFRLPLEISEEAEAVDRTLDLAVQYRNDDFEKRQYTNIEAVADIRPQRDQFTVEVRDREITAGDGTHIDVAVTNNLDQTVTDVEARLFADDPLDSNDDEGFVEALEPGETTTMTFELSADDSAAAKTYPVSFDFRYDDERGTSQLSDTTRVAIDVEADEGGLPIGMISVLVLTGLGAGAYVFQRR